MKLLKKNTKKNRVSHSKRIHYFYVAFFLITITSISFAFRQPIAQNISKNNNPKPNIIIKIDNWKLVKYQVYKDPIYYLFDLEKDPFEKNNLANQLSEKRIELTKILENARTPSEYFTFK